MTIINMHRTPHVPGTYVYIGRPRGSKTNHKHYGNPFTHEEHTQGYVKVGNRSEAVATFASWLRGTVYTDLR